MTKVIFIVFTFALGISPRELVRLVSASSNAILCRRASVNGTVMSYERSVWPGRCDTISIAVLRVIGGVG